MKEERSYTFVFLQTIIPVWLWCLHDLALYRLAELRNYVPVYLCLYPI